MAAQGIIGHPPIVVAHEPGTDGFIRVPRAGKIKPQPLVYVVSVHHKNHKTLKKKSSLYNAEMKKNETLLNITVEKLIL